MYISLSYIIYRRYVCVYIYNITIIYSCNHFRDGLNHVFQHVDTRWPHVHRPGRRHVDHGQLKSKQQLREDARSWRSFQYVVTGPQGLKDAEGNGLLTLSPLEKKHAEIMGLKKSL